MLNYIKKLLNIKEETTKEMKDRISKEIRDYNKSGISSNWYFQAQDKL